MSKYLIPVLALLLALPLYAQAGGPQVINVTVQEYGLFESDIGEAMSPEGPGNQQQVLEMTNERLVEQTNHIPLRTGIILGVHYIVNTDPAGVQLPVTLKLIYPDGSHIWGETTIDTDKQWFNSYTINDPGGHPEGTYHYVIEYNGQVLVELPFEFYHPGNTAPSPEAYTPKPKHAPNTK